MSYPLALPQFTVQQFAEAAVTHDTAPTSSGGDVQIQEITGLVTFTPNITEVVVGGSSPGLVRLDPIIGRLDTDGNLKGINSEPVYYLSGTTRNPCPAGLIPVFGGSYAPLNWVDEEGNVTANPDGTPVWGVRLIANSSAAESHCAAYLSSGLQQGGLRLHRQYGDQQLQFRGSDHRCRGRPRSRHPSRSVRIAVMEKREHLRLS